MADFTSPARRNAQEPAHPFIERSADALFDDLDRTA